MKVKEQTKFIADDSNEIKSNSNPKKYQDAMAKLQCFGHCGSKGMKFLMQNSNYEIFESYSQPLKIADMRDRKAPAKFFDKFSFVSEEAEAKFCNLLGHYMFNRTSRVSMGWQRKFERHRQTSMHIAYMTSIDVLIFWS